VLAIDQFTARPHASDRRHGKIAIIREAYFEDPLYVPLVCARTTLGRTASAS